jgi:hypothetical protein
MLTQQQQQGTLGSAARARVVGDSAHRLSSHVKELSRSVGRLLTGNLSLVSTLRESSGEISAAKQSPVQVDETQELQLASHGRSDREEIGHRDSSSGHSRCSIVEIASDEESRKHPRILSARIARPTVAPRRRATLNVSLTMDFEFMASPLDLV